MDSSYPAVAKSILEKKTLDDALKADLKKMLDEFKSKFVAEKKTVKS